MGRRGDQLGNHNIGKEYGTGSLNLGCNMRTEKRKHGDRKDLALPGYEEYLRRRDDNMSKFKKANIIRSAEEAHVLVQLKRLH